MGRRLFIDSSAFIALEEADDVNHASARAFARDLTGTGFGEIITSSMVFLTLMDWFAEHAEKKVELGEKLRSGAVRLEWVDRETEEAAWRWLQRDRHHPFTLTDCTSFVIMDRLRIWDVFTFNSNFARLGKYRLHPSP
jgi:predicted nucleic acid-binding protein